MPQVPAEVRDLAARRALLLIASVALAVGPTCSRSAPTDAQEASGTLASMPEDIPGLGGRGVWIVHDGLYVDADRLDPMRTPFKLLDPILGDLKVGDRVVFTYQPLPREPFPFSASHVRRLTEPPPVPHPTSDKKQQTPDWLRKASDEARRRRRDAATD